MSKAKTKAPKANRRGRPKGAKNKEYAETICIPAICPKCQSSEMKVIEGTAAIERDIEGTLSNGYQYSRVKWSRCLCECGQLVMLRKYLPTKK